MGLTVEIIDGDSFRKHYKEYLTASWYWDYEEERVVEEYEVRDKISPKMCIYLRNGKDAFKKSGLCHVDFCEKYADRNLFIEPEKIPVILKSIPNNTDGAEFREFLGEAIRGRHVISFSY